MNTGNFNTKGIQIQAHSLCECVDCKLAGAVYIAIGVNFFTGNRANVYDVTAIAFGHSWNDLVGYIQQPFYIYIHHRVPILKAAAMNGCQTVSISGIVDQYINVLPLSW